MQVDTAKRVLLVRWGTLRIHDYYLALMLKSQGYSVTFGLYSPHYSYRDKASQEIRQKVNERFEVLDSRCGFLGRQSIRLAGLIARTSGVIHQGLYLNDAALRQLGKSLSRRHFDAIIAIEHASLRLAVVALPDSMDRLVYYSLEICRREDEGLTEQFRDLLEFEREMLGGRVAGLIIQDPFRAEALLGVRPDESKLKICYAPVSVPGVSMPSRSDYFDEALGIAKSTTVLLYFGAVYGSERKLDELLQAAESWSDDRCVLVLHGSREFRHLIPQDTVRVRVSESMVPVDQLPEVLQGCDVGIAIYDNDCLNTRLTAYSSEKITRYLQCGKPFIAFRNESTQDLRSRFRCCELIDEFSELEAAVKTILNDYEAYSRNCTAAFESLFSQDRIASRLGAFLVNGIGA